MSPRFITHVLPIIIFLGVIAAIWYFIGPLYMAAGILGFILALALRFGGDKRLALILIGLVLAIGGAYAYMTYWL